MASTDARPVPIKNTAFRATFCIWDADGDLVTGAADLDSEVSKDGGAFADCTNEATEIGSSGIYYLDLTSTEMNADAVCVIVKTSTVGAKTTPIILYPEETGDINIDVTAWNGTAIPAVHTAGYPIVTVKDGTGTGEIDTTSGGVLVAALANNAITAAAIAADAIGASELAADAATEIGTAVWATAARTVTAATNITSTGAAVPITAGGLVSADVTAISTDTTAANNAESFFDGTGYAGTNNVIPTVTDVTTKTGYRLSATGVDDILDEVMTEPSATFTWAGATLRTVVAWLGALARNRRTTTATTETLRNDANDADISTSTVSDDATTFVRSEWS